MIIKCSDYPRLSDSYRAICFDCYATPLERIENNALSYIEWVATHGGHVLVINEMGWAIRFDNNDDAILFLLRFA